jgi:hypothetical protein
MTNLTDDHNQTLAIMMTLQAVSSALCSGERIIRTRVGGGFHEENTLAALREALASIRNGEHRNGK